MKIKDTHPSNRMLLWDKKNLLLTYCHCRNSQSITAFIDVDIQDTLNSKTNPSRQFQEGKSK